MQVNQKGREERKVPSDSSHLDLRVDALELHALCEYWRTKKHRSNDNNDTHGIPLEGVVTGDELTRVTREVIAARTAPRYAAATSGFGIHRPE